MADLWTTVGIWCTHSKLNPHFHTYETLQNKPSPFFLLSTDAHTESDNNNLESNSKRRKASPPLTVVFNFLSVILVISVWVKVTWWLVKAVRDFRFFFGGTLLAKLSCARSISAQVEHILKGDLLDFLKVIYSTLLHLPPLRLLRLWHWQLGAPSTWLDLIPDRKLK